MEHPKLYIKNMVCNRCIMVVKEELQKLEITPLEVSLGEVILREPLNALQKEKLQERLEEIGFSLIDNKRSRTIEQIKRLIIELVQDKDGYLESNLSDYIGDRFNLDYNYLSNLFSEIEGTTIERYFISQKIEKVKELLVYGELSLKEISFKMNYSSPAHLSNQFRKVTGLNPSYFQKIRETPRTPLDKG
ncbi:MAG: AraC family transcriptional regulator [Bacteroidales bacterium]|nr:AraC family transcriptional regulator [Bacteroidales bacterium]